MSEIRAAGGTGRLHQEMAGTKMQRNVNTPSLAGQNGAVIYVMKGHPLRRGQSPDGADYLRHGSKTVA